MAEPFRVGIIGCGNISTIYCKNLLAASEVELTACADLDEARANARAAEFGIRSMSVKALLADPAINLVLNLTVPTAHAGVSLAAIRAGKHIYSEKPLATTRRDGKRIINAAAQAGVRVGCAPDTFLGGGLQTVRELVDSGRIGRVVAATAFMTSRGPEGWHPNPEFFYKPGAGPLFDMGPYYLTTLISILGPVTRVTSSAQISFAQRRIGSQPLLGQMITVETPTHIAATLDFASGAVATFIMSFDVWKARLPYLEFYGEAGSISLPDPNFFAGPVQQYLPVGEKPSWEEVPITRTPTDNARGIGLIDMALAIQEGRPHRASGELAYHVLDVMETILAASRQGRHLHVASSCERPASL